MGTKKHNTGVISSQLPVLFHPEAETERAALEPRERVAADNVVEKLRVVGVALGYPHSSAVRGVALRELRPRAGKSRTRLFYRRIRDAFVIAGIGPEAAVDPREFRHAVATAQERLSHIVSPRIVAGGSRRTGGKSAGR